MNADLPELIAAVIAGILIALTGYLKTRKKKNATNFGGYSPNCISCPLFRSAIDAAKKDNKKNDQNRVNSKSGRQHSLPNRWKRRN